MNNLKEIFNMISDNKPVGKREFYIPRRWNYFGYKQFKTDPNRQGEICVDPLDFYQNCIEKCILGENFCCKEPEASVCESVIYGMLPRFFTAWPHYEKEKICGGTFLKSILLLPLLKSYNVNMVYLLPVSRFSSRHKKGELGSPYAVRDIYALDEGLHDDLLGAFSTELLQKEFRAFVEACHCLGIKVVVDFVFRTVARDNVLVGKHPDWFYWIKSRCGDIFQLPFVDDAGDCRELNENTIEKLYHSQGTEEFLKKFTCSPDLIDPAKWDELLRDASFDFDTIENEIGVTTVPGFSDVINDSQPAWTDVTYLKYYFDNAPQAEKYINPGQQPYIMQDGASLSRYHGKRKNEVLWRYITDVLPYYRMNYNIDGARIDMAHALPYELNGEIIRKVREVEPDFILWSEELDPKQGKQAKRNGFDFISGFTFENYKKINEANFNRSILVNTLKKSALPVVASLETPDTPRAAFIHQDRASLELLTVINCLMPNSLPYINSGQELLEIQPMNLGLDNSEEGRFVLPEGDPMRGKLALFDSCCLHWLNDCERIGSLLTNVLSLRARYKGILCSGKSFILPQNLLSHPDITVLPYYDNSSGLGLFVLANRSINDIVRFKPAAILPPVLIKGRKNADIAFANPELKEKVIALEQTLVLKPCQVIVATVA